MSSGILIKLSKNSLSKGSSPEIFISLSAYLSPSVTTKVMNNSSRSSLIETWDESNWNCKYPLSL